MLDEKALQNVTDQLIGTDKKLVSAYLYANHMNFLNCIAKIMKIGKDTSFIRHYVLSYEEGTGLYLCRIEKYLKPVRLEHQILFEEIKSLKIGMIPLGYKVEFTVVKKDGQRIRFVLTSPMKMEGSPYHKESIHQLITLLKKREQKGKK